MGNCGSKIDCTGCAAGDCNDTIDADNDIVGNGVLASFFVSALLTILSIIYAYFSDSLPSWYLNEVDAAILATYESSWVSRKVVARSLSFWSRIGLILRRWLRGDDSESHGRPLNKEQRIQAVTRFVLALSDQQLVTGLAILIGAMASRCTISTYELGVVVSLAWFSSTTHLATLDVLRDYFIHHQVVRNIRLLGIVPIMILLSFALIVEKCFDDLHFQVSMPMQCAISGLGDGAYPLTIMSITVVLSFLIYLYTKRISNLFGDTRRDDYEIYVYRHRFARLLLGLKHRNWQNKINASDNKVRVIVLALEKDSRKRLLERAWRSSVFVRVAILRVLPFYGLVDAFGSNIPVMLFGLAYGVSYVSFVRWNGTNRLAKDADAISFGQIVPLLLLLIPTLAAIEIYYEAQVAHEPVIDRLGVFPQSAANEAHPPLVLNPLSSDLPTHDMRCPDGIPRLQLAHLAGPAQRISLDEYIDSMHQNDVHRQSQETVASRISTLDRLAHPTPDIRSINPTTHPTRSLFTASCLAVAVGACLNVVSFLSALAVSFMAIFFIIKAYIFYVRTLRIYEIFTQEITKSRPGEQAENDGSSHSVLVGEGS